GDVPAKYGTGRPPTATVRTSGVAPAARRSLQAAQTGTSSARPDGPVTGAVVTARPCLGSNVHSPSSSGASDGGGGLPSRAARARAPRKTIVPLAASTTRMATTVPAAPPEPRPDAEAVPVASWRATATAPPIRSVRSAGSAAL